ncbi:MAG: hypothetical protein HC825_05210 [Oscillatoriales cyanobacterium RM1_1_9]|nr:hypothetical protein [Oscillatoriales cyanobacterium RM1_1_9]
MTSTLTTSALMSFMDPEYLDDLASKNHESYITAEPFPHIIIDNFLPEFVLDAILEEFPEPGKIGWKTFDDPSQKS